jgi:hypothetical protein
MGISAFAMCFCDCYLLQTPQKPSESGKKKSYKGTSASRKSAIESEVDPRAHLIEPHIESFNYFVLVITNQPNPAVAKSC